MCASLLNLVIHRVESSTSLGGVWKFRQAADEISIDDLGDLDDETDFTDESSLGTPLPDTDMSFFDPLHPAAAPAAAVVVPPGEGAGVPAGAAGGVGDRGAVDLPQVDDDSWLLSALSACAQLNTETQSSSATSQEDSAAAAVHDDIQTGTHTVAPGSNQLETAGLAPRTAQGDVTVPDVPGATRPDEPDSSGNVPDDASSVYSESSSVWDEFDPLAKSKTSKIEVGRGDLPFSLINKAPSSQPAGKLEIGKGDLTFGLMGSSVDRLPPDGQDSSAVETSGEPDSLSGSPSLQSGVGISASAIINNARAPSPKSSPLRFWSSTPKGSPQHRSSTTSSTKSSPARSPRRQLMDVDLGERGKYAESKITQKMQQHCRKNLFVEVGKKRKYIYQHAENCCLECFRCLDGHCRKN